MDSGTPSVDSTRRTRAGGTVAPPLKAHRMLERSRPGKSGWSSWASSMVGTPTNRVPRSDSIRCSIRPGSNPGGRTWVNRPCTAPSVTSTHPAVWISGIGLTHTSPGPACKISAQNRALLVIPRCRKTAPFGKPVVPEVYWICAASSGRTSGRRSAGDPEPTKLSQSASEITSRRLGSWSRTCAKVCAKSAPR